MRTLLLLFLLLLCGCGSHVTQITTMNEKSPILEPILMEYLEGYYQQTEDKYLGIRRMIKEIKFGDLSSEDKPLSAGTCFWYVYGNLSGKRVGVTGRNYIIIDTKIWQEITDLQRKYLVWHEAGHCTLGLLHVAGEDQLMNPFILPDSIIELNWSIMVRNILDDNHPRSWAFPNMELSLDDSENYELISGSTD